MKNCLAALVLFILAISGMSILYAQQGPSTGTEVNRYQPDLTLNNLFREVVSSEKPPRMMDTLETRLVDGTILVEKIRFESVIDAQRTNRIFAYAIHPKDTKNVPAVLLLHGGTQTADDYYSLGLQFARRGYATLIPDLPGITSPEWAGRKGRGSSGKWANEPYGKNHFLVQPNVQASNIYEGIVTAVQAFYLLKNQPYINKERMGIRGLSWGGYATVMTASLLGKQVKAAFAVYGSGFYDLPSYFKSLLDKMDDTSRKAWIAGLDAGRYAHHIRTPFYFMAASNDTYFHPPAVLATYDQLKGKRYVLFSPNNDHSLSNLPSPDSTEFAFFDHYLKKQGNEFPVIRIISNKARLERTRLLTFAVKSATPISQATLWFSNGDGDMDWTKRTWRALFPLAWRHNRFEVRLPAGFIPGKTNWYITVTDSRGVSAGTVVY